MTTYYNSVEGDLGSLYLKTYEEYLITDTLVTSGQLWEWGDNSNGPGQLGDNTILDRSSPVQTVAGGTNWKQVVGGGYHTAGIQLDNSLWLWGQNSNGQLGDNTTSNKSSPVQTVSGGTNWKQVSCGYAHTAAIKIDGTLWSWGYNGDGELGDNTVIDKSSPVQTVSGGSIWRQVSSGDDAFHTAAIKNDGTLWSWGYNQYGQLGNNATLNKSSPIQTVAGGSSWNQLSVGMNYTAAVKNDGTLWLWGQNSNGQLGDNSTIDKSSPIQSVAAGTTWKQVACGDLHAAAIKTDGTLWLWGFNLHGQLGDNTTIDKSSPIQTVAGGTDWKQVDCGGNHTATTKTNGTLWCWGYNSKGQLGDNSITDRSSPVQTVSGGSVWRQVACGLDFTAAVTT